MRNFGYDFFFSPALVVLFPSLNERLKLIRARCKAHFAVRTEKRFGAKCGYINRGGYTLLKFYASESVDDDGAEQVSATGNKSFVRMRRKKNECSRGEYLHFVQKNYQVEFTRLNGR